MNDRIKLVQGDTLPFVRMTLKHADGEPMDVSAATVRMRFRQRGTTTVLSTLVCTKPNGGIDGVVVFNFAGGILDVDPGYYEGEVEVDYAGTKQTIYNTLQFQVRAQFA
jgi:hypothetical protein